MAFRSGCIISLLKNNKCLLQNCSRHKDLLAATSQRLNYGSEVTSTATPFAVSTTKVSKAMKAYLERSQEHEEFMKQQQKEFQMGKRHLANMMGEDAETFTQDDIDAAIEYLFPSGLFDPKARPKMKSPEEVFPARKAAEFDETGRPFHSMFYTGKPNYFKLCYDIVEEMKKLYELDERMLRRGQKPDPNEKLDLSGFQWVNKDKLENILVESIADIEYTNFTTAMERLASLPYAYRVKDFIYKFTKPLMDQTRQLEIPKPQYDEEGRQFVTINECLRKTARGNVTLRMPGKGNISINGRDIMYFDDVQCREQLLFPLVFTNMLAKVDVEAHVAGGGPSGQSGAIRWGIAMALRSFVDQETVEEMRLAGLLTRDYRRRERKKFGQEGARRKFTWKKR